MSAIECKNEMSSTTLTAETPSHFNQGVPPWYQHRICYVVTKFITNNSMGERESVIKMAKVHDMIRILESCLAYNHCVTDDGERSYLSRGGWLGLF